MAWEAALTLAVTVVLSYSWMFTSISVPNERSRIYLAVAMVDHSTVAIDEPVKRFGRIHDLAKHDGHLYSDKAPGSSFLAAAVYKVVRFFSEPEDWPIEDLINLMRSVLMIPIGIIGFLLIRRVLRHLTVDPPAIDLASLGWILGSSAFHYSTAFFGHQIVAVCLLAALAAILSAERELRFDGPHRGTYLPKFAVAGLMCGIAGLTEYQAGVPCVLLALYVLASSLKAQRPATRIKGLVAFALPALVCVVALLFYNSAAFGGVLELSYHHLAHAGAAEKHTQGIGGVTLPTWEYVNGALFSMHRGLLTTSPFFVLAPIGFIALWRMRRGLALTLGATCVFYILFISSSNMWYAGWGFGPRLLVPAMAFMAILAGVAIDRLIPLWLFHGLARGLTLAGILYHQAIHAFFPEAPDSTENPLVDIVLPMARADLVSPNLVEKFTQIRGLESLIPLALVLTFVAAVVLVRGIEDNRGGIRRGALGVAAALIFGAAHVGVISQLGGTWTEKRQKKFETAIDRWTKHENVFRRQALDAANELKTMDQ